MSKIAALQARLGGGAGIMMGLRPGGGPPMKKKKPERRHSLDNVVLNRPINKQTAKKKHKKFSIDSEDEKAEAEFGSSLVSDIDASQAKTMSSSSKIRSSTPDPSPSNSKYSLQMKSSDGSSTSKPLGSVNRPSKDFRGNLVSGRSRSGTLKETCEMTSNDMDTDGTITVKFYHSWDNFFKSEASNQTKGFKISSINEGAFGTEFKNTGVQAGWHLVKIGKRTVGSKNYTVIRGDLEKNSKFGGKGGYTATFKFVEQEEQSKKEDKKDATKSKVDKYDRMGPVGLDRQRSASSQKAEKRPSAILREARGKSVATESAASLIKEDAAQLKKTVKLKEKINEYVDAMQASTARKGLRIDAMCDNAFAKELIKLGIKGSNDYKNLNNSSAFWTISGIGDNSFTQDLSKKNYINIRDLLTKAQTKGGKNGYEVTFKANAKDVWTDSAISSPTSPSSPSSPSTPNAAAGAKDAKDVKKDAKEAKDSKDSKDTKEVIEVAKEIKSVKSWKTGSSNAKVGVKDVKDNNSNKKEVGKGGNAGQSGVELIKENLDEEWKEIRMKEAFDKYFNGERDDCIKSGMKGFMITSIASNSFGKDFRNLGISNKWRIWKLNDLDVSKLNHMVLRNKLTMAAKKAGAGGYNITFISPAVTLEKLKTLGTKATDDNKPNVSLSTKSIDLTRSDSNKSRSKSPRSSPLSRQKSRETKSPRFGAKDGKKSPMARQKSVKSPKSGATKSPRFGGKDGKKVELKTIELENKNSKTKNRGKSPRSGNNSAKSSGKAGIKVKTVPTASTNKGKNANSSVNSSNKGKNGNSKNDTTGDVSTDADEVMKLKQQIQQLKKENETLKLENSQLKFGST